MQIGLAVLPGYKTPQTTDRQTDRRHAVPKARPIVRSAKNGVCNLTDSNDEHFVSKVIFLTLKTAAAAAAAETRLISCHDNGNETMTQQIASRRLKLSER